MQTDSARRETGAGMRRNHVGFALHAEKRRRRWTLAPFVN
jgi:hypothetical protein